MPCILWPWTIWAGRAMSTSYEYLGHICSWVPRTTVVDNGRDNKFARLRNVRAQTNRTAEAKYINMECKENVRGIRNRWESELSAICAVCVCVVYCGEGRKGRECTPEIYNRFCASCFFCCCFFSCFILSLAFLFIHFVVVVALHCIAEISTHEANTRCRKGT